MALQAKHLSCGVIVLLLEKVYLIGTNTDRSLKKIAMHSLSTKKDDSKILQKRKRVSHSRPRAFDAAGMEGCAHAATMENTLTIQYVKHLQFLFCKYMFCHSWIRPVFDSLSLFFAEKLVNIYP